MVILTNQAEVLASALRIQNDSFSDKFIAHVALFNKLASFNLIGAAKQNN